MDDMALQSTILLAETLKDAGVTPEEWCATTVEKLTHLLQQSRPVPCSTEPAKSDGVGHQKTPDFPHEIVSRYFESLSESIKGIGRDVICKIGSQIVCSVCAPYLRILLSDNCLKPGSRPSVALKPFANLLCALLLPEGSSACLGTQIINEVFVSTIDQLCSQRSFESKFYAGLMITSTDAGCEVNCVLDPHLFITLLCCLFETATIEQMDAEIEPTVSTLFERLLILLQHCDLSSCFLLTSSLLPHFVTKTHMERVTKLWDLVVSVHCGKTTVECSESDLILVILCCFHDVFICHEKSSPFASPFFPEVLASSPLLDLRSNSTFWSIVQEGLVNSDPLSRKRCMYLLHCVLMSVQGSQLQGISITTDKWVFWWSEDCAGELQKVWEDAVLMLETMEEKQIHIVMPVRSRLKNIMAATSKYIDGHSLLHISWLMVVLSRVFVHHEAKTIVRWGVQETLNMNLEGSPLLQEEHWKFIFGPLLTVLNETPVYGRDQNTPRHSCPPVAQSLNHFLERFVTQLSQERKGPFVTKFISAIQSLRLVDIPLVFVSHALSLLPGMPLIDSDTLAVIRSVVLTCIMTHKPSLRAATQCFLLTTAYKLTDLVKVSCLDVILTLGSFRDTGCLTFGSHAWIQARGWVRELNHHKWASSDTQSSTASSLFEYLQEAICDCLRNKVEKPLGASHLARFVLLAIDAECNSDCLLLSSKERSLEESVTLLLAPVMDVITGAQTHVYMSTSTVHSALEMLVSLLTQFLGGKALKDTWKGSESPLGGSLYKCLLPWLSGALLFVQEELLRGSMDADVPDLEHVKLYVNVLDQLYHFMQLFKHPFHSTWDIGPAYVASKATEILMDACSKKEGVDLTPQFLGAVTALAWLCSLSFPDVQNPSSDITHNHCNFSQVVRCFSKLPANLNIVKQEKLRGSQQLSRDTNTGGEDNKQVEWGPLMSHCFLSYWKCILCTLKYLHGNISHPFSSGSSSSSDYPLGAAPHPTTDCGDTIAVGAMNVLELAQCCLDSVDVAGQDLAVLIECLSVLVPKLSLNGATFLLTCIDILWPLVLEFKEKHRPFLRALKAFLLVAFHPLLLHSQDPAFTEMHHKYASKFFELGEARTGVYNLLVTHVSSVWQNSCLASGSEHVLHSLETHMELITQACLFGPVHKKNLRPVEDTELFLESLAAECSSNSLSFRCLEDDKSVRVDMLSFLMHMASMCQQNADNSKGVMLLFQGFLCVFINCLLEKIADISVKKPKYYINSFTHRIKMRLLQTLLLVLKWTNKATAQLVAEQLLQALQWDNQLSVRYLMEWVVIIVLSRYPELLDNLFYPHLHHDQEKRLSRMCSIFTIALHVGRSMKTKEEKTAYYLKVFPAMYQWTSSYHFVVRLYSQQTVICMWEDFSRCDLTEVLDHFRILENTVDFMKKTGDTAKFGHKLRKNIFFSQFRPDTDLNIECIFYILPRVCHVIEEEWIPVEVFTTANAVWRNREPLIKLHCDNMELLHLMQEAEPCDESGSETRSIAHQLKYDDAINLDAESGDVQKKITPWSSAVGVLEELFPKQPLLTMPESALRHPGGLVLVASFVSKVPNLGGLCRTCEIFGVNELVLSNLKLLEEKQFQSLSVTAEKWIKITEVKLASLREYLLSMRGQGYSLVGVEQTAQSKCITKYQFQRRTVLVLGNEREGIPVEVIHLLDDCVEIPQFGVIRSLNVHVSGALMIWEYTKQYIVTDTSAKT